MQDAGYNDRSSPISMGPSPCDFAQAPLPGEWQGMTGTKSEIVEELDRAIEAASEAEEILRDVGDRVGEGKAMHTIAVSWMGGSKATENRETRGIPPMYGQFEWGNEN